MTFKVVSVFLFEAIPAIIPIFSFFKGKKKRISPSIGARDLVSKRFRNNLIRLFVYICKLNY